MSDDTLILATLLRIEGDIGAIKQNGIAQGHAFTAHCVSDQEMAKDILALQLEAAKTRGAAKVWNLLGAAAGTLLGAVAGYFGRQH